MNAANIPGDRLPGAVAGADRASARTEAIAQLAASERPDREVLLTAVLENTGETRRYRVAAAIALGRIATPIAETALLRNIDDASDETFVEVVRSLGRIGGSSALEAVGSLRLPPQDPRAPIVAYAATLIAHRLGLSEFELPSPGEANLLGRPTGDTRPIDFVAADASTGQAVLDDLEKHPYGIAVDPTAMTLCRCAGEINVICPNRRFSGGGTQLLTRQSAILALVALQSRETSRYSPSYVVLSHPRAEGAAAITIHSVSGREALAGSLRVVGDGLDFDLRAVWQPGAWAMSLSGTMSHGRLEMSEAVASTVAERRLPARRTVA